MCDIRSWIQSRLRTKTKTKNKNKKQNGDVVYSDITSERASGLSLTMHGSCMDKQLLTTHPGRKIWDAEELDATEADAVWIPVLQHLSAYSSDFERGKPQWSLDNLVPLLGFLGCLSGCDQAPGAQAFIEWIKNRRGLEEEGSLEGTRQRNLKDLSSPAVLFAAGHKIVNMSRSEIEQSGKMSKKALSAAQHKLVHLRFGVDKKEEVMQELFRKIEAHKASISTVNNATAVGMGIQSAQGMKIASFMGRHPTSLSDFPRARKLYEACAAIHLCPTRFHSIVKLPDKSLVRFIRCDMWMWLQNLLGGQHFNPDISEKLRLLVILVSVVRYEPVDVVTYHKGDEWGGRASALAEAACTLVEPDAWWSECNIDWQVLASVLYRMKTCCRPAPMLGNWSLGARLNVFNISDQKWAVIKSAVAPSIHKFGTNMIKRLNQAACLPQSQYAEMANALYTEYMSFVNSEVGSHTGWRLPSDKKAPRHTEPFKLVKRRINVVKDAIKVCKGNMFLECKKSLVSDAIQIIDREVGELKYVNEESPFAQPYPNLREKLVQGDSWVLKQNQFLEKFAEADENVARYKLIDFARRICNYTVIKKETFEKVDSTCPFTLQEMAEYLGNLGKKKDSWTPPTEEEVMEFLGPSPIVVGSARYDQAVKRLRGDYMRWEYEAVHKHKAKTFPGILGVPGVVFNKLMSDPSQHRVDLVDLDLAFANALRNHRVLYDSMRTFMCMLLQKSGKPDYKIKKPGGGYLWVQSFASWSQPWNYEDYKASCSIWMHWGLQWYLEEWASQQQYLLCKKFVWQSICQASLRSASFYHPSTWTHVMTILLRESVVGCLLGLESPRM